MKYLIAILSTLFYLSSSAQESGIIINEFSNGAAGSQEYLELLVVGCQGIKVDLRGWIIDDNNGDFSGGPKTGAGIAMGHFRFRSIAQWQAVPVGTIILVYNAGDKNTSITIADDANDSNNDSIYIVPSTANVLERCSSMPTTTSGSYTCSGAYTTPAAADWQTSMGYANGGDAAQTRKPDGSYFHGLGYGGSPMTGGPDNIYFAGNGGSSNFFFNGINYRVVGNFSKGTVPTNETPGRANNAANLAYINSIKVAGTENITLSSNSPLCVGQNLSLGATNLTSYSWTGPNGFTANGANASRNNISKIQEGYYVVSGINSFGCPETDSILVMVNNLPTVSILADDNTICNGATAILTASGAISFVWEDASTANPRNVNPTTTTTYSVTGTDNNGCSNTANITITVNPLPSISITADNSSICNGATAMLTASGATSFVWEDASTANPRNVSPTTTTTYSVSGTDNNGCSNTANITITVNPLPSISITTDNSSICNGATATLTASGATSYVWEDASTANPRSVSPTTTTTYSVSVTDNNGCSNSASVVITINNTSSLSISTSATSICLGQSVDLLASGADTYLWDNNSSNAQRTVSPTTTTTYRLTGNNNNGCQSIDSITITVNALPNVGVLATTYNICRGDSLDLSANGANSYTWNDGTTGQSRTVKPNNTSNYTVTGRDLNGCENSAQLSIQVFDIPSVNISATSNSVCSGQSADLTASGAQSYLWEDNSTQNPRNVNPSSTSTYTVLGTSSNGCTATASITITVEAAPIVTISTQNTSVCIGESIVLIANSSNSSFVWDDGTNSQTRVVSITSSSTFSVTATNGFGCTANAQLQITALNNPIVNISSSKTQSCAGEQVNLTASGAQQYFWNDGNQGALRSFSPNNTTSYQVIGIAANGCIDTATILITVSPTPNISIVASSSNICLGQSTSMQALGAQNYTWLDNNSGVNPRTVSPTQTTSYQIRGTNNQGCSSIGTFTIVVNPLPNLLINASKNVICIGETISLQASGANSYTWDDNSTSNPRISTPNSSRTYSVQGRDQNGCIGNSSLSITVNALPNITINASPNNICQGQSSSLQASGAQSYTWVDNNSNANPRTVSPNATSNYTVVGTAANGCTNSRTVNVVVSPLPIVNISSSKINYCQGETVMLTASGTNANYLWENNSSANPRSFNALSSASYQVTATNNAGCSRSASITIQVNALPNANVSSNSNSICEGETALLNFSASGKLPITIIYLNNNSNALDSILLSASNSLLSMVQLNSSNSFQIISTRDDNGCINNGNNASVNITVNPKPIALLYASSFEACNPGELLFINQSIGNISSSTFYLNNNPVAFGGDSLYYTFNSAGDYIAKLTVTNDNNCSDSIQLAQPIRILNTPFAQFELSKLIIEESNPQLQSFNRSENAIDYAWYVDGELASNDINPLLTLDYQDNQDYQILLEARNGAVCLDTFSLMVRAQKESNVFVPNAFTPDGDGINDIFIPMTDQVTPGSYRFEIFNRWGELIFESSTPNQGWDGTYRGVEVKNEVYIFKLVFTSLLNNAKKVLEGKMTLLR